jgi:hypothetical protein
VTGVDSGRNNGNLMGRRSGKTSNAAHARACKPKDVKAVNPRRERSFHDELIVLANIPSVNLPSLNLVSPNLVSLNMVSLNMVSSFMQWVADKDTMSITVGCAENK